jgi:PadR family transcriptional regulator, regulatory protein PadR
MRLTHALVQVAQVLAAEADQRHWGYSLSQRTGVRSGVLYPMLSRMLEWGWLSAEWEDPGVTEGRLPRRYYCVSGIGRKRLNQILDKARRDQRFQALFPGQ